MCVCVCVCVRARLYTKLATYFQGKIIDTDVNVCLQYINVFNIQTTEDRKEEKYLDVDVVTFSFPYAISRSSVSKEWLSLCSPLLPPLPFF